MPPLICSCSHLKNNPPTEKVDETLFGTEEDTSNQTTRWYQTAGNLPWAIEISGEVAHPLEKTDTLQAYPYMKSWIDNRGLDYQDWYLHPQTYKTWHR